MDTNTYVKNTLLPFIAKVRGLCNVGAIPLVFDNSLSYYEQLCAFSAKLNEVIATVNNENILLSDFMNQLTEAFTVFTGNIETEWQSAFTEYETVVDAKISSINIDLGDLDRRVTALENAPGGDGVGRTITPGTEYTYDGQTYTAGTNAEIFGCYETSGLYHVNEAAGSYSHAEGVSCKALGSGTHAEGSGCIALVGHAEGEGSISSGEGSHAEGAGTTASGDKGSHSEGWSTTASGYAAHAEGTGTTASGSNSHAAGYNTTASGAASTAIGTGTTAAADNMVVMGAYNNSTTGYALVIGNGTASDAKSDLFKIGTDGTFTFGANAAFDPQADHNKIAAAGSFVPVTLTPTITPGGNFTMSSYSMIQCGKVIYFSVDMTISSMVYSGSGKSLLTLSDFPKAAHDVIFSVAAQQSGNGSMYTLMQANTSTWAAEFYANDDLNTGNHLYVYGSYITSD